MSGNRMEMVIDKLLEIDRLDELLQEYLQSFHKYGVDISNKHS